MKKVVLILLAILTVTCLALGIAACKSDCANGNHDKYVKSTDAATCTAAKLEHWACRNCDWTSDETVGVPLGHDYADVSWTPSATDATKHEGTCAREGCNVKKVAAHTPNEAGTECTLCHANLGGDVVPHEHDYTGAAITVTEDGTKHQVACTVEGCGHVEIASHIPVSVNGKAATCTTAGKQPDSKCSVCNHVIKVGEVIPATGHDYAGQPWKTSSSKHYQECKNGCGVRNEHAIAMGEWTVVGEAHQQKCTVEGCGVAPSSHEPVMSFWVTLDETNHYKQCVTCGLHSEEAPHDHSKIASLGADQHSVECYTCGKQFPNADHVWNEGVETKAPTCTEEGIKTFTCACGRTKTDNIPEIPHTLKYENTPDVRIVSCSVCNNELDRIPHTFEMYYGDRQQHWEKCETCDYERPGTRADHDYTSNPDSFVCKDCGRVPDGITVSVYYNGTYTSKDTLAEAIAFITDNSEAIIYLGTSIEGAGIVIPENRNITLRLMGNTYTVTSAANNAQGIVLSKNSTVRILNGNIDVKANSGVTTLVANYANLTLTSAVLDGTNLDAVSSGHNYTLRNYYGTAIMTSTTIKAKTASECALDVLYGTDSAYMDGVSVTVGASSIVEGFVQYGSAVANADWSKVVLKLRFSQNYIIYFSCDDVNCDTANIKKVNTDNVETQLQHRKDDQLTCDKANSKHYYACNRCDVHIDEVDCNKVAIGEAVEATCTSTGKTAGSKCSVCETVYEQQTTVEKKPHEYYETWTAIDALQHAHKCANCSATKDVTNHTYQANVCSGCGKTITEAEILAALDNLDSGEYLSGQSSTFVLTGKITNVDYAYTENNGVSVTIKVGDTSIYCFKMRGSNVEALKNLQKGDTITVLGSLTYFQGKTLEFDNGCALQNVTYANVSITLIKNEDVTVEGLVNEVERYTTVKFTVDHNDDELVVVKVNGGEIVADENDEYSFKASVASTVEIVIYDANTTRPHDASKDLLLNTENIKVSTYDSTEKTATVEYDGKDIEFGWINIYKSAGFQFNSSKPGKVSALYNKTALVGLKLITLNNLSSGSLVVTVATNAQFTDAITLTANNGVYTVPVGGYTFFKVAETAEKAAKVESITVTCVSPCGNTESFTEHSAQEPTCTEDGTIRYWTCDACGAKFSDELCNNQITNIVAPAKGHKTGALVEAKTADCTKEADGHVAYYKCENCNHYFEDSAAQKEIENITVPYEHKLVKVNEKLATKEEDGKDAYWKCSVDGCTACFEDEKGERKIEGDINSWGVRPALPNCEHKNTQWIINADNSHSKQCTDCSDLLPLNDNGDTKCYEPFAYITDDKTHMAFCETCGYEGKVENHISDGNYEYFEGGSHISMCDVCDYDDYLLEDCEIEDGACKHCLRIVGSKVGTTETLETIISSEQGYINAEDVTSLTQGKVTLTFAQATGTNAPKYYTTGTGIRTYTNNTITISVQGAVVTSVTFVFSGSYVLNNYESNSVAWSGAQLEVIITHTATSQSRIQKIIVGYKPLVNCYHDGDALVEYKKTETSDCETAYCSADCWHCEACGKSFSDEACTNEITVEIRAASGHDYGELHPAVTADCVTPSNIAYYQCSVCHKYFNEDKQKVESTDVFGSADATAHDLEWHIDEDKSHYQQCKRDGCDYATDVCNGLTDPVVTSNNNGTHNLQCSLCEFKIENEDCSYNDDDVCTVCNYEKPEYQEPITWNPTNDNAANQSEVPTITLEGVTITFNKGSNSNPTKYFNSDPGIRAYGGNTITITAEDGKKIAKIEFVTNGGNAININGSAIENGTWTGSEQSVQFTIAGTSGNCKIKSIIITFE